MMSWISRTGMMMSYAGKASLTVSPSSLQCALANFPQTLTSEFFVHMPMALSNDPHTKQSVTTSFALSRFLKMRLNNRFHKMFRTGEGFLF